ncbi:30S ribosomal protein S20 [Candidatus Vallotia tarda]|uniref:Small ribosomal subunit protein bS20 n=1 Tax=Candidatus Vallotiella hemipterorum TaxID=1177213 RepID=A0A916NL36_9BURK|nr:30S ribosomal protein S20 [Candidatus Vallotia tarda]CAG7600254.1 30S ribosomal protein S20 [Candidatus Vallotia tarda]
MANSAQARKRTRQAAKANSHNSALRSKMRTAIKVVRKAINSGNKERSIEVLKQSSKTLDIIADKKIIHKNKAARHKSRLASAIKGLMQTAA